MITVEQYKSALAEHRKNESTLVNNGFQMLRARR